MYACVFDRPQRAIGTSGGGGSAYEEKPLAVLESQLPRSNGRWCKSVRRARWSASPFPAIRAALGRSRRRRSGRGWKRLPMPRCWSTVPGGQSSLANNSAKRRCGGRSADWVGRIKKSTGSQRARRGGAHRLAQSGHRTRSRAVRLCRRKWHHHLPNSATGWAPHDRRATGSVPRNHGKNTTLVAALAPEGLQVPWMIEGAMKDRNRSSGTSPSNWPRR